MLKNTDQKNSKYRHFLRSVGFIAEKKIKLLKHLKIETLLNGIKMFLTEIMFSLSWYRE